MYYYLIISALGIISALIKVNMENQAKLETELGVNNQRSGDESNPILKNVIYDASTTVISKVESMAVVPLSDVLEMQNQNNEKLHKMELENMKVNTENSGLKEMVGFRDIMLIAAFIIIVGLILIILTRKTSTSNNHAQNFFPPGSNPQINPNTHSEQNSFKKSN